MKGLDTSVLLALLHGDSVPLSLLKRLRDVEFGTTEANLLELTIIAAHLPAHARRRREVIERLRRKITVLPLDSMSVDEAGRHLEKGARNPSPLVLAMLGALDSAGCDELYTQEDPRDWGRWRFKVTRIAHSGSKKAKYRNHHNE